VAGVITVDGSYGEGGGQILRIAVALSALRAAPVVVTNIRAGRRNPGLAAQHVTALEAVASLSGGEVDGLEIGSKEIAFRPGETRGGRRAFEVGTAGSVTLVLQACLPVAFSAPAPVRLRLTGGTDVRWSPPLDYFARVFLPILRRMGLHADVELLRRGYYPRGGGVVEVSVEPAARWSPIQADGSRAARAIRGIAHVSNLPADIPKRMKHAALRRLHGFGDVKIEERVYAGDQAIGQGGALVLWAETEQGVLGSSSLAERAKPSERIGEEAARELRADIEAGVSFDIHAADQVLVYLAHATGPSAFTVREVSGHLTTMIWLLDRFGAADVTVARDGTRYRISVVPKL